MVVRLPWLMRPLLVVALAGCSSPAQSEPLSPPPRATEVRPTPVAPQLGDTAATGKIIAAHVAAAVGDDPADEHPAYARADQRVMLYAVIEVDDHGKRTTYSDAPALRAGSHAIAAQPLAHAPAFRLAWNRIEPAEANYSNTDDTGFHFTAIDYRATAIEAGGNHAAIAADVRPTLTPDHGANSETMSARACPACARGVGTMRFQIVATQGDRNIASPGPEAHRGRGSGGLTDDVLRVSIRRDDTYLGYLTEMFGQPYVWASAGITDATHQSERLEGSDCADFVVYGARRMGAKLAYTWTGGLPDITKKVAGGTRGDDGIYRDAKGVPVPFTQPGDLVLFPRHVGVLVEDRGTIGVLDDQDIMMHTLFDSPKEQPIADTGYADKPLELRRFTADLRRGRSR